MRSISVTDTNATTHAIIQAVDNGQVIFIVSADSDFTLDATINPITGFSTIHQGVTLVYTNDGARPGQTTTSHRFYGTSTNSDKLGGLSASSFVRSDVQPVFASQVSFPDSGFTVGQPQAKLAVANIGVSLTPTITNQLSSTINFQTTVSNITKFPMSLQGPDVLPGVTLASNLGSPTAIWQNIYANYHYGTAQQADALSVSGVYRTSSTSASANTPYKLINGLSLLSGIPLSEFITAGVSIASLILAGVSAATFLSPVITSITTSDKAVKIYFTQPTGSGLPSVTNYVYSTNGTTYTTLSPVQTTSPLTISGLTNGTTYSFTLQSVISSGGNSITSNAISIKIIPLLSELIAQNETITAITNYGYTNQEMKAGGYAGDTPKTASELLTSLSFFTPSIIKLSNNITFSGVTTITNTSGTPITITKTGATPITLGL
jgi:hypothetical protein